MSQFRSGLVLVAGALALTACASKAPVNSTAAVAASASAPTLGTAAPAAPDTTKTAAVPKGYRLVVKKGTDYFCRTEAVTGSHTLKNEVCLTPDEYEAERTHGAAPALGSISRPGRNVLPLIKHG